MTLDKARLRRSLEALAKAPGATHGECAKQWADAVGRYFLDVQLSPAGDPPPAPNGGSLTVFTAQAVLQTQLTAAFASYDKIAVAQAMDAAFQTFGASVALGMFPMYNAVAPVPTVGFLRLFEPPFPKTHVDAASAIADAIHAWAKTGTATLAAPPNTPAVWS